MFKKNKIKLAKKAKRVSLEEVGREGERGALSTSKLPKPHEFTFFHHIVLHLSHILC